MGELCALKCYSSEKGEDGHIFNIILKVLKTLPPDVGSLFNCVSEGHCQIANPKLHTTINVTSKSLQVQTWLSTLLAFFANGYDILVVLE